MVVSKTASVRLSIDGSTSSGYMCQHCSANELSTVGNGQGHLVQDVLVSSPVSGSIMVSRMNPNSHSSQ